MLPSAVPGIVTAMVLTGGRIIGETAPLILTTGTTISANARYSLNPLQTGETLAVHIWVLKIVGVPGLRSTPSARPAPPPVRAPACAPRKGRSRPALPASTIKVISSRCRRSSRWGCRSAVRRMAGASPSSPVIPNRSTCAAVC